MIKRRAVCIFHPDFDPDTSEAVEAAATVCKGMSQAGQAMVEEMIKDLKRTNPKLDDVEARDLALAFEYRVKKVEI